MRRDAVLDTLRIDRHQIHDLTSGQLLPRPTRSSCRRLVARASRPGDLEGLLIDEADRRRIEAHARAEAAVEVLVKHRGLQQIVEADDADPLEACGQLAVNGASLDVAKKFLGE